MPGGRFVPAPQRKRGKVGTPSGAKGGMIASMRYGEAVPRAKSRSEAMGTVHPHSIIDDAVNAVGRAIGGIGKGSNIKGGPFPGGVNAVQNALNSSKRR